MDKRGNVGIIFISWEPSTKGGLDGGYTLGQEGCSV